MRDLVWTIIIIWVVYKVIDIFRGMSVKKTVIYSNSYSQTSSKKDEGSVTVESPINPNNKTPKANATDGEYVDFEEIK